MFEQHVGQSINPARFAYVSALFFHTPSIYFAFALAALWGITHIPYGRIAFLIGRLLVGVVSLFLSTILFLAHLLPVK